MKTILHPSDTRGKANHGWLNSAHTFSFGGYQNSKRMNFGMLRVLNDDQVAPGMGFNTHPHRNMEIVSIPLEGDLEHKDNTGTHVIIKKGDIQVMSAGTGIEHSEYNANKDKEVKFLQIWIIPNQKEVTPRYDQITLNPRDRENTFEQILSPNKDDAGVWIHQSAWFHLGTLTKGTALKHTLKDPVNNGIYAFVIQGSISIGGQTLSKRDGMGITETDHFIVTATQDAEVLLMEVPLG